MSYLNRIAPNVRPYGVEDACGEREPGGSIAVRPYDIGEFFWWIIL